MAGTEPRSVGAAVTEALQALPETRTASRSGLPASQQPSAVSSTKALTAILAVQPASTPKPTKSPLERLMAWDPAISSPPIDEDTAVELARLDASFELCSKSSAAKAIAIMLQSYISKIKKWDDSEVAAYTERCVACCVEYTAVGVMATVTGPNRVQLTEDWPPSELRLTASLKSNDAKERAATNRARLAMAIYAAEKMPDVRRHAKWHFAIETKNAELAFEIIQQAARAGHA